jgi:cyanophycinase
MARAHLPRFLTVRGAWPRALLALAALVAPARGDVGGLEGGGGGRLLIVGGGLKADNAEVLGRFLALAGGPARARVGVFPTASLAPGTGQWMVETLGRYGLPEGAGRVIPITSENAATTARDPAIVAQIAECTGLFFSGGDQSRITRALYEPDGSDTPALAAIRGVLARGGVVGGSSAGAAIMGDVMHHARGPAFDTLDFGLGREPHHRGSFVEPGLGFYHAGPVDQHFNQRGRLARLARVLVERKLPLGVGIDEDTAIVAAPAGPFEVIGRGGVTVVDASAAEGADGPLGFHATGLLITYLERGDRFDPATRTCAVHPGKAPVAPRDRDEDGPAVADLAQRDGIRRALTAGLVESPAASRAGVFLRAARGAPAGAGHGYRFTFAKTDATHGHFGELDGAGSYAVCAVRLDVEPIAGNFDPPETILPLDLDDAADREAVEAVVFRDLMRCDDARAFHPSRTVSRAEFADVLTRAATARRRGPRPEIADMPEDAPAAASVAAVVASGLMRVDAGGAFRPDAPITRREVAEALARARSLITPNGLLDAPDAPADPRAILAALPASEPGADPDSGPATREEVAIAVARFLGLPW